ncbi:MAG: two-component system, OmpR family, sensor histidine kinase PrrB [Thermoleophilaceae bacterium]|nr:two-component system, OmpR family, sensor histidine kinase PrrB [Thermoleophilaceae bacterium]
MLRSLRVRVALATVLAVALVVGIVGWRVVTGFATSELRAVNQRLVDRADQVAPRPGTTFALPAPGAELDDRVQRALAGSGDVIRLVENGVVVGAAGDVTGVVGLPVRVPLGLSDHEVNGAKWRMYAISAATPLGAPDIGRQIQIATPLAPVSESISRLRSRVVTGGIAALVGAALAGWLFGAVALRSLGRLRGTATQVSSTSDLSVRIPVGIGPAEVDELASTLNAMLERLQLSSGETVAALEATRRFAADAGHELRTPLTVMGANLETLKRNPGLPQEERTKILGETIDEQARLVTLLTALQSLARADARAGMEHEPVDLGELVDAAVEAARRRHPEARIDLAEGDPVPIEAWPAGVRLMVDNLIENAVRHGGGSVDLRVDTTPEGGGLLEVDDAGPGVPEDERDAIFERFSRGTTAAGDGSGLGLALVGQQAALHQGSIEVGSSEAGGARFSVTLPARPKPDTPPQ